jgi:GAF domain-containing protein
VFPQVSQIANKVLAHDLLTMMFDDRGQILIEVASSDEFPEVARLIKTNESKPKDGFIVIDDFTTATLPIVEPADLRERIVAAGYRSSLAVFTRARDQEIGLGFWSRRAHAFGPQDVPIARRLAAQVALAVSHEHLADAARRWPRRMPAPNGSNRACSHWSNSSNQIPATRASSASRPSGSTR